MDNIARGASGAIRGENGALKGDRKREKVGLGLQVSPPRRRRDREARGFEPLLNGSCAPPAPALTKGWGPRLPLLAQGLLRDALDVVKVKGPDGKTRFTIKPLDSELSFDKGFYVVIRAIQALTTHNKDFVLVGGSSSSRRSSRRKEEEWCGTGGGTYEMLPSMGAHSGDAPLAAAAAAAGGAGGPLGVGQDCVQRQDKDLHPGVRDAVDGQLQRRLQSHRRKLRR